MRTRIFMVDDEADLVWTVARHFRRERPDYEFQGFSDPIVALRALNEEPPHLLITDLRMRSLDGLELAQVARARSPELLVLVITAYGTPEVRQQAKELGAVDVVEKPFDHRRLLRRVDQALDRLSSFSGQLSLPMLSDVVQMLAMSQRAGQLQVTQGEECGEVWFDEGRVVHCAFGELQGREAFQQLLRLQRGKFQTRYDEQPPVQTIDEPLEGLLLDSLRLLDEDNERQRVSAAEGEGIGPLSAVFAGAERWEQLPAADRQLDDGALLALVSLADGTAVVLEAENDDVAGHVGPWVAELVSDCCVLDSEATVGSTEWLESTMAWALTWDLQSGMAMIYGEPRSSTWRAVRFGRSVSRLARQLMRPDG